METVAIEIPEPTEMLNSITPCLLYTSDAADE